MICNTEEFKAVHLIEPLALDSVALKYLNDTKIIIDNSGMSNGKWYFCTIAVCLLF